MDTEKQDEKYAFLYRLIIEQRTELEKLAKRLKEDKDIKGFDFLYSIIKDQQNEIEYLSKRLNELEGFVRKDKVNTYAYGTGVDYGYMVK